MKLGEVKPGAKIVINDPSGNAVSYIVCFPGNTPGIHQLSNKRICTNLLTGRVVQKFKHLSCTLIPDEE